MTDNEIIKALKCCSKCTNAYICTESKCPLFGQNCLYILSENALNLINRKNEELERLTHNLEAMAQTMPNMAKAERAEAVKEFAARVKQKTLAMVYTPECLSSADYIKCIDDLVKEMTAEAGNNDVK